MAQMSINTERVGTAINRISQLTSDIKTRTDAFVTRLIEVNTNTKGKWKLIQTLQTRVEVEQKNVGHIIEAQETIIHALNRFSEMAEEVNDDSAFRE